jgi:hypothetical protein
MNVLELKRFVSENIAYPNILKVGDEVETANNSFCLIEEQGKWIYFYSERGSEFDRRVFGSEDEACQFIVEQLKKDPALFRK